jgi:ATP adenylyltransferase
MVLRKRNAKSSQFEFHITGALKKKPIMAADAPGRTKAIGPFVNPDPKFVIASVGPLHTLELSMYCVHRPGLVLHTNAYRPQTEALDKTDLAAAWAVLHQMEMPCMILYNCGVEAGSSQGHKHLQVIPKPHPDFGLFLDGTELSTGWFTRPVTAR